MSSVWSAEYTTATGRERHHALTGTAHEAIARGEANNNTRNRSAFIRERVSWTVTR